MKNYIVVLCLLIGLSVSAQTLNTQKLDSLFSLLENKNKAMGSVFIHKDGKEIYQRSIGYVDVENELIANQKTKYRIGSITKTYTATMIMQLVDEKKLTLETLLKNYFPEVPNSDKITIEHLLRHRSGLFNITNDEDFRNWMLIPNTRKEMLGRIVKKEIVFEPNTDAKYSNTNYLLLGYILEEIENKSYAEILESRIIVPCNLKDTYYGSKIDARNNEANSYAMHGNWKLQPETDMSVPGGAGAIVSTPKDIAIFYHNLFSGELVSKESLSKMKKQVDRYGMGLITFPYDHLENYGHSGGIDGFQSVAVYVPGNKSIITYTSNALALGLTEVLLGVAKISFNEPYKLPEFKPALKLTTEELDPYLGIYKGEDFPFQITMTKEDIVLIVNAKDGPTFPIKSYEKNRFKSDQAGVKIQFFPKENRMVLELGGKKTEMIRE